MMASLSPKSTVWVGLLVASMIVCWTRASDDTIEVQDSKSLRSALSRAQPGITILLVPGRYESNLRIERISGTRDKPVIIAGKVPDDPPLFEGGNQGIHLVDCNYVTLRHIRVTGSRDNGINADDGGTYETPSEGLIFEMLTIENIGPKGNHDALKLSGLRNFVVRRCTFSGWGGSAIDMVGCHDGMIEHCRFLGKEGYSQSTGVQAKGGSERVVIRCNFFWKAGERAVNLGGSTGLPYFRPQVRDYEAKDLLVVGNHFVGSMAPIAYVTSLGCIVRRNTIVRPEKWVIRVLQEQPTDKFQPCQQGVFEKNLIVFDRSVQVFVNIGPNTRTETFSFQGNAWFSTDGDRRPTLPTKELDGIYQVDPMLENEDSSEMRVRSADPRIAGVGAHSFQM